jgi:hypothetical protein
MTRTALIEFNNKDLELINSERILNPWNIPYKIINFLEEHKNTQFSVKELRKNLGIKNLTARLFPIFKANLINRTKEKPYKYLRETLNFGKPDLKGEQLSISSNYVPTIYRANRKNKKDQKIFTQ